jgi:hypothetical protein
MDNNKRKQSEQRRLSPTAQKHCDMLTTYDCNRHLGCLMVNVPGLCHEEYDRMVDIFARTFE